MSLNLARINKIREKLAESSVEFYLVSSRSNLFYLLSKQIEGCLLIPQSNKPCYLISDARYKFELQELENKEIKTLVTKRDCVHELVKVLSQFYAKANLGLEPSLNLETYLKLKDRAKDIKLKKLTILEELRMIKDDEEITSVTKAVEITRRVLSKIKPLTLFSKTELQIQALLDYELRKFGSGIPAFSTIVAASKNSAYPHAVSGPHFIRREDAFVLIDCGGQFNGYCADLTQMYFWDKIPKVIRQAHQIVKEVQRLAISLIKDGIKIKTLLGQVERFIKEKKCENFICHGLGHGIGIEVHERPILRKDSEEILKAGMVITIEPGLYFPGVGGVRLEDVILVGKNKGILIG